MQFVYDPFVLRRFAEGRIFVCTPKMPFEFFINCFQMEKPFFLVSQLEDGRVVVTPNVQYFPQNFIQFGYGSLNLLPVDFEYVTLKDSIYPMIITAHPVQDFGVWLKKFESQLGMFARQTLSDFIQLGFEFEPLKKDKLERKPVTV